MNREQLRELCAKQGDDPHRLTLFIALNALFQELRKLGVICEAWIDGSFVTEKAVPSDVDVSLMIDSVAFDALTQDAKNFINDLAFSESKYLKLVDAYVCIVHPKGTIERDIDPPEGYADTWGIEHNDRYLKGFIVMELPDALP